MGEDEDLGEAFNLLAVLARPDSVSSRGGTGATGTEDKSLRDAPAKKRLQVSGRDYVVPDQTMALLCTQKVCKDAATQMAGIKTNSHHTQGLSLF